MLVERVSFLPELPLSTLDLFQASKEMDLRGPFNGKLGFPLLLERERGEGECERGGNGELGIWP